jgi:hypothetical protein
MTCLGRFTKLIHVLLQGNTSTSGIGFALGKLPQLLEVRLYSTITNDETIKLMDSITKMTQLQVLKLEKIQISSQSVQEFCFALSTLKMLQTLEFLDIQIGDDDGAQSKLYFYQYQLSFL